CLTHRLALFAHADDGHCIQPGEESAIGELNVMCNLFHVYASEAGIDEQTLQGLGVSEAVSRIDDPTHMLLGNRIQVDHSRDVFERAPCRNRHATAWCNDPTHFANRSRLVRHELESLMASQDSELLAGAYWKRDGVPRAPVNRRIDCARD